jgi:hypothetical protein
MFSFVCRHLMVGADVHLSTKICNFDTRNP